jgi:site-specific DNA-methyltransferase (adenine-specific)
VILFSKGKYLGKAFGDVIKTSPNNNDKRFHKWGQSEEGFSLLFDKFVLPGQTILDPFVGGGTTAVVALKRGCNFIGVDKDLSAILTTKKRCQSLGVGYVSR